jgi:hypothetical protein
MLLYNSALEYTFNEEGFYGELNDCMDVTTTRLQALLHKTAHRVNVNNTIKTYYEKLMSTEQPLNAIQAHVLCAHKPCNVMESLIEPACHPHSEAGHVAAAAAAEPVEVKQAATTTSTTSSTKKRSFSCGQHFRIASRQTKKPAAAAAAAAAASATSRECLASMAGALCDFDENKTCSACNLPDDDDDNAAEVEATEVKQQSNTDAARILGINRMEDRFNKLADAVITESLGDVMTIDPKSIMMSSSSSSCSDGN